MMTAKAEIRGTYKRMVFSMKSAEVYEGTS